MFFVQSALKRCECVCSCGNSPLTVWVLCVSLKDPHLRNLESRFALQVKIVEAALKLVSESDLKRAVKKKRKSNYLDALGKLEQIEKEINGYRIAKGRKPSQRASLILAGTVNPVCMS